MKKIIIIAIIVALCSYIPVRDRVVIKQPSPKANKTIIAPVQPVDINKTDTNTDIITTDTDNQDNTLVSTPTTIIQSKTDTASTSQDVTPGVPESYTSTVGQCPFYEAAGKGCTPPPDIKCNADWSSCDYIGDK